MVQDLRELPRAAWGAIVRWTLIATGISVAASVFISDLILGILSEGINGPGLVAAILLPLLLGGPMMFYHALRHQQLKHANQKLQVLASTDWLTACLNRRAFTALVDTHLHAPGKTGQEARGALLVVDADNFKTINDGFGHDSGDEALRIITEAIKSAIRPVDLLGRIGGEEFGVFLPGCLPEQADAVAERIRQVVCDAEFRPNGQQQRLSVSVGGAVFERGVTFCDLFRTADQQLYLAKQNGRNRVAVRPVAAHDPLPAAAA